MKKNTCSKCRVEAECAANDWCLYDHRNKKCTNWLEGVKQYHKFLKEEKRDEKLNSLSSWVYDNWEF